MKTFTKSGLLFSLLTLFTAPLFASTLCNQKISEIVKKHAAEPISEKTIKVNPYDNKKDLEFDDYAYEQAEKLAAKLKVPKESRFDFSHDIVINVNRKKTERSKVSKEQQELIEVLISEKQKRGLYTGGDEFNSFLGKGSEFNRIQMSKNETTKYYYFNHRMVGYQFVDGQGNKIYVGIDSQCQASKFGIINSSGWGHWTTPEFCQNLSTIEKIKNDLPEVNNFTLRCQEQGADDVCRCKNGKIINPYIETCLPERGPQKATAADQFEDYANSKGTRLISYSRSTFERVKEDCLKIKNYIPEPLPPSERNGFLQKTKSAR